jgi:predicted phosphodiesterase
VRLHAFSDIHLEFGNSPVRKTDADVVVAAGDIGAGLQGAQWLMRTFDPTPVIYVIGNHEPYGRLLEDFEDRLDQKCASSNVIVCRHPGHRIEIGDVRFLGTTLWTDYDLQGDSIFAMGYARRRMSDYGRIRVASTARRYSGVPLTPEHVLERHRAARKWLEDELGKPWSGKTVLVTHHAPTAATLEYPRDALSPCYASNLEDTLDGTNPVRPAVDLAIHGHTHVRADVMARRTRVIVNARGYARYHELVKDFDPQLVVEL